MKKPLFSLFLLLASTAVWAGTGNGSKEDPYSGEWRAGVLKPGDHLAYDCKILASTKLSVIDDRLNLEVVTDCSVWNVGDDVIGSTPKDAYAEYCSYNSERETQTFIVTEYNSDLVLNPTLKGYFSGPYTWYELEGYINVKTADELKSVIQADNAAKVHLDADIDVSAIGKICDTFRGIITGEYDKALPETSGTKKAAHTLKGRYTAENTGDKKSSYLFDKVEGATFESIVFANFMVHADADNLGIIAKTAAASHFKNLVFHSNSLFNNDDYVGAVAGYASSCEFDNVMMQNCDITTDALYAGGLVGMSESCTFNTVVCGTTVYVFADGGGINAYCGGITGHSQSDVFANCNHLGMVGANDNYVGGMTGYSVNSNFVSCSNGATVVNCNEEKFVELQKEREKLLSEKFDEAALRTIEARILAAQDNIILQTCEDVFHDLFSTLYFMMFCSDLTMDRIAGWGVTIIFGVPLLICTIAIIEYIVPEFLVGLTGWLIYYDFTGDDYASGIVGCAEGGKLDQCSNFGFIHAIDKFVGGIAGDASGVVIDNCLNVGTVHQDRDNGHIDGCYRVGGIIGRGRDNTKVTNCLTTNGYPICGARGIDESNRLDQTSGNNYSVEHTEDYDPSIDFLEMPTSKELLEHGMVAFWLNNGVENREKGIRPWHQNLWAREVDGKEIKPDSYPILGDGHDEVNVDLICDDRNSASEDVRKISDASGLQQFASDVNSGKQFLIGYLENDIDMTGQCWNPIGQDEANKHFRGIFDGQGHTIQGLKCTSDQAVGLFGAVHVNAEICNVIIGDDCEFTSTGDQGAGAIVGTADINWKWGNVIVENCGNYGKVNGKNNAGGIFGRMQGNMGDAVKAFINNCFSVGTVTAEQGNSGLIGGYMRDNAVITNCWSSGKLVSSTWEKPFDAAQNEFFAGYDSKIDLKNCYAIDPDQRVQDAGLGTIQVGVRNFKAAAMTGGEITYYLNGSTNNAANAHVWQQNLGTDAQPVFGDKGVYHTRTVSDKSKGYGTVCLPYALKSNDEIRYYTFSESSSDDEGVTLNFELTDSIPAGIPALFVTNPGEVCFNSAGDAWKNSPVAPASATWRFTGTYAQKTFADNEADNIYYISGGAIKHGTKATIDPYRAYFEGPSIETLTSNGSKSIRIRIDGQDDETTALQLVTDDSLSTREVRGESSYTLFGTKAGQGYRGIVIRGGKKVLKLK